jgi:hypothetical protein
MKTLLISISLFLSLGAMAQYQGNGGSPKSYKLVTDYKQIDTRFFSEPNIDALRAEDELTDDTGTAPWRFGYNNPTSLTLSNAGTWMELPNGDKIWQVAVKCENALTVNLTFADTKIPEGNIPLPEAELVVTLAGHASMEEETRRELVKATDRFKHLPY